MINKEKLKKTYLVLYTLMVLMVSYTAMNSPYMAENYLEFIIWNSFVLWASSYYLMGYKRIKIWFKDVWRAAKKRSDMRKAVEEGLKARGY